MAYVAVEDDLTGSLAGVLHDVDAVRAGGLLDEPRQPGQLLEHAGGHVGRHICHVGARVLGQQQGVAVDSWEGVQNRHRMLGLEDAMTRDRAVDDLLEQVLGVVRGRHPVPSVHVGWGAKCLSSVKGASGCSGPSPGCNVRQSYVKLLTGVMLVYHDFCGDIASQINTDAREKSKQPRCARQDIVLLPRSNAG